MQKWLGVRVSQTRLKCILSCASLLSNSRYFLVYILLRLLVCLCCSVLREVKQVKGQWVLTVSANLYWCDVMTDRWGGYWMSTERTSSHPIRVVWWL